MSNKMELFAYKVSVAHVGMHVLRHLKEGLAWAKDK